MKFPLFLEEFATYMKYARNLKFEERPDYVWIRRLFKDLFYRCEYQWDLIFEWAYISTVNKNIIYKIKYYIHIL